MAELVQNGVCAIQYISTKEMIADALTSPLS